MKKTLFIFFAFITLSTHAQLNSNADFIKTTYATDYTQTIRKHAVEKWNTDHEMVVYEINNQSDALISLIDKFKSENTQIFVESIVKWSHEGFEASNLSKLKNLKTLSLANLMKFHCDWEMVEYEYDNQVKAKSSY